MRQEDGVGLLDDPARSFGEVGLGLHADELRGLEQAVEDRGDLGVDPRASSGAWNVVA